MPNQIISTYLSEMEQRLEAPYRGWAVIGDFGVSLALALMIGFVLLAL
jgi:hypothetical protein